MRGSPPLDPASSPAITAAPRRRATPGGRAHPHADTLVGIVNYPVDLHHARTEHWYRIPEEKAPRGLRDGHMRCIAFYQPRSFREEAFRVRYVAPIERITTHKRRDLLPDQPRHPRADTLYLRLELGPLAPLPHPIPSLRQRRIVFIATTLAKLVNAAEINDLYHDSPLEDTMWQAFKCEGVDAERQYFVDGDRSGRYALDFAIFGQQRNLNVECDGDNYHANPQRARLDNRRNNFLTSRGWSVLRFTTGEINHDLPDVMRQVQATIRACGGIAHRAPATEPPNLLWQAALWAPDLAVGHSIDPRQRARSPRRRRL